MDEKEHEKHENNVHNTIQQDEKEICPEKSANLTNELAADQKEADQEAVETLHDEESAEAEEEVNGSARIIEELQKEKEELYSRLLRLQADFDNYRKRVKAERQEYRDFILIDLVEKLLPVLDNLERALHYADEKASEESLQEGVKMIYRQFIDILAKEEITQIECKGKLFDPCYHEAVAQEEVEGVPSQAIIEELRKGYKLKDKVIRASMVKVNK
ncbi:MAG: nucleotide exchange factor GrpE [Firmicutes bacterium]|nr:nucleotide exchange factor GrpE [Bacillota bacterium]